MKYFNGQLIEETAEELAKIETDKNNAKAEAEAEETAKQAQEELKASAKAKLIAGEPLTEEEADTIVL